MQELTMHMEIQSIVTSCELMWIHVMLCELKWCHVNQTDVMWMHSIHWWWSPMLWNSIQWNHYISQGINLCRFRQKGVHMKDKIHKIMSPRKCLLTILMPMKYKDFTVIIIIIWGIMTTLNYLHFGYIPHVDSVYPYQWMLVLGINWLLNNR